MTTEALKAARESIAADRECLFSCHVSPVSGAVEDRAGLEGLAEYDAVLALIDAALAEPEPRQPWSEAEAVAVAHRAGFAGTHWSVGPEELAHLLNMVAPRALAEPQPVDERAEPMEMALCERHSLVLRVGVPYVFRPVGDCPSCAAMVEQAREAYGDSLGAAMKETP
jgi:hypothetical protein